MQKFTITETCIYEVWAVDEDAAEDEFCNTENINNLLVAVENRTVRLADDQEEAAA